jgi:photosystem II stability/assembly factor-like uncharacterized protein
MAGLIVSALGTGGVEAGPVAPMEPVTGTLTVTLEAGDYTLHEGDDGQTHIQMNEDFGFFGAPGEPELPARAFLIALPPGSQVANVCFETPHGVELSGRHQIAPVEPAVFDPEDADRATARWEANRERVYATDEPYPGQVGEYLGQGQWRRYTTVRVAFQPFSYRPLSGVLHFHPTLVLTIEYRLPEPGSPAWHEVERLRDDHVLDDLISRHLVNFDQARVWYDGFAAAPLVTANSLYDYVIVVQNDTMAETVAPFKTWKESLGHTVKIVTLDWIHSYYSGVDVAEEVWNFLHDKYPSGEWGIRYVLLVGDLQVIPRRLLFYSNPHKEWGLQSDHFFAKLSGGDTSAQVWNSDGDQRWGEIDGDEMSVVPDVLVGRIPLNDATNVGNALQAMISFEQDNGTWKHRALLAGGYNDIASATKKTDNAVLMEYIRDHLLDPNGWAYTRIYEQSGLGTSTYTGTIDYDTSRTNVVTAWNASAHGLAILADHGNTGGLSGHVWQHDTLTVTNQVDPGEWAWSDLFHINDANLLTTTHPSIVELLGCATLGLTTPPWPTQTVDQHGVPTQPGGYADNTGRRLLAQGAAAGVVGFTSPVPYWLYWTAPTVVGSQTAGTYFTENLVQNHYTLGWSLYEAKIRYTNNYYVAGKYRPIPWAFTLFGDPSMILEGYDDSAQGSNKTIHTGPVYAYGTDNADNGDMYVAVSTRPDTEDGEVKVYRSTNHGDTWSLWATVGHGEPILAVDVIVGQWEQEEFSDDRVHVFFTDNAGNVMDARIDLANPASRDDVLIASEGAGKNLPLISAARDAMPMPSAFNLYVTWEVDSGTSHQVKVRRSTVNGGIWTNEVAYDGYQQPHIDAGPFGLTDHHVYLTAVADAFPNHVHVKRSTDRGANWGGWANLTSGDNGDYHGAPVVAASTDAAFPTVWVAYNYYETVTYGGADLRFAYSKDGGSSWTKSQILSAEQGFDELMPDMVGYRTGPSRWMNIAYHHSQSARTNVVWRWASGSTPGNWWAPRPVNDNDTHPAMGPQVIYSPGAAATGSGVVYPGTGSPVSNLYFAAPWLTSTASDLQKPGFLVDRTPFHGLEDPASNDLLTQTGKNLVSSQEGLPAWAFTGQVGEAFRVAGLARHPGGPLFAASTTREVDEANTGTVFRSDNGGETWEPVPALPLAWWLDSILVTDAGTLLVGGMMFNPEDPGAGARGVIYRSTDMGEHWSVAVERADTGIVHTLLQRANGEVVAGAGPGGITLVSSDDGEHWEPMPTPPNAEHVYTLLETSEGMLHAGGERTGGSGVVYRFTGEGWEETGALDNAAAVYALLEGPGQVLYAGATFTDDIGRVFQSFNGGESWEPSDPLGESQAVRALLEGAEGRIYAGVEGPPGWFTAYAYVSEDVGESWQDAGYLFMADAVYDLLSTPDGGVYAASGDTYGVIFRAEGLGVGGYQVYLPLVLRNF